MKWLRMTGSALAAAIVLSLPMPAGAQLSQAPPQPAPAAPAAPATPAAVPISEPQAAPAQAAADAAGEPADRSAGKSLGVGPLRELSPWSMFLSADLLVKAVMICLVFASLVTWTILIAKTLQLSRAGRQLNNAVARIAETRTLTEAQLALGRSTTVLTSFLAAAVAEIRLSADSGRETGIKERAASQFSDITRIEARAARYGMGVIATIGATAPFVGLFGTVWGIMDSFIGISKAQTTNLAVVAPGIAQALLATAIGLAAAIPAVIIYNHFSRVTKAYMDLVGRAANAVGRLLSRDLDRFAGRIVQAAAE